MTKENGERKRKIYTVLGRKIAHLARNQSELATVLELTQQSVSGKLSGKIAVTLHDMELLAKHYEVPMSYFVTGEAVTVDVARRIENVLNSGPEMQQLIDLARKHNATGWKVNGAGGAGGSLTILSGPDRRNRKQLLQAIADANSIFKVIPIHLSSRGLSVWQSPD